jgi:hypothetical protein
VILVDVDSYTHYINVKFYDVKEKRIKSELEVCDDAILTKLLCFWTLSIVLFLFKTHNVSETGFLFPSSGGVRRQGLDLSIGPN